MRGRRIFKLKRDAQGNIARYKAHWVARGDKQRRNWFRLEVRGSSEICYY